MKRPTQVQYKAAELDLRLSYAPEAADCKKCGWPVLVGYCCGYCGDTNPSEPTAKRAIKGDSNE